MLGGDTLEMMIFEPINQPKVNEKISDGSKQVSKKNVWSD